MRGAVAALGLVLAGWPLAALGQTVITPDVAAGRTLGTTVGQAGTVFNVDGGTRAGDNLFHSFSRFDLGVGDTARWVRSAGDGGSIANVVSRVTGGQASHISGTIDSTALPNAAFYFVNPAGIVFGQGAVLNVPAAAHFSTAAELRFADGSSFAVATPNGSTLSMAPPEAWGFLGGQGGIDISGVGIGFVPGYTALSFTAADLNVTNARFAAGGLDMVAVGDGAAAIRLAEPLAGAYGGAITARSSTLNAAALDTPGGPFRLGAGLIDLEDTKLVTDTAGLATGADLILKADTVRIARDSFVITSTRGPAAGGNVFVSARELSVDATGGTITTGLSSVASAGGAAGAIRLTADDMRLSGGAFVGSTVSGAGDAGDVAMTATNLVIDNGVVSSSTFAGGDGGDIRVRADAMDFGAATIVTSGFGAGVAGDVFIDGRVLALSGGFLGSTPGGQGDSGNLFIDLTGGLAALGTSLSASSFSANASGFITVRAPEVFMAKSTLSTAATADGLAGRLLIETGSLIFDEVNIFGGVKDGVGPLPGLIQLRSTGDVFMRNTNIFSNANGRATGGVVMISGANVELLSTEIRSDTISLGQAGKIDITADSLSLTNTLVTSSSDGEGDAGLVRVTAGDITLKFFSAFRSDASFVGAAGGVAVFADTLDIQDGSQITSEATAGTGDAGQVLIDVGRLLMTDGSISSTTKSFGRGGSVRVFADEIQLDGQNRGFTSIAAETLAQGQGGDVIIDAGKITLDQGAVISSTSFSDAPAGDITIRVGELSVLRASLVSSTGIGFGDAGEVSVVADKILIQSEVGRQSAIVSAALGGAGGNVTLQTGSLVVDAGAISSDTLAGGDAGEIRIAADAITLKNSGSISSSTNNFGNAGSVSIAAKSLVLETGGIILSAATSVSNGDAGEVEVTADRVVVGDDSSITTATFGPGRAGSVAITAKSLRLDGGLVSSSADRGSTGASGEVHIDAEDELAILNGGSISTLSLNPNRAGLVDIRAGTLRVDGERSLINSENQAGNPNFGDQGGGPPGPGGDAGVINIRADNVTLSNGGRITTNSFAGAAGDIFVGIERPGLFILEGAEAPGVIQTSSGPGTGGRITIVDPLAIVSNGGAILALGQQRGANVVIRSRYFINSTDRLNVVDVDGEFQLQTGLYDVSSGTVARDLSVLDASKVLRGQCPAARSTGAVSQLITRPVGPYARESAIDVLNRAPPGGGCP